MSGLRRALAATAAALALADASIVALALPPILVEFDTTISGVAAIVGVYALVVALAIGRSPRGPWGMLLFAAGSIGCALAPSLSVMLLFRAVQAVGAAGALLTAYEVLDAGESRSGRRLWVGAALIGTAAGPAVGGVLTELFDWRAIFAVQVPIALAAAWACAERPDAPDRRAQQRHPALARARPAGLHRRRVHRRALPARARARRGLRHLTDPGRARRLDPAGGGAARGGDPRRAARARTRRRGPAGRRRGRPRLPARADDRLDDRAADPRRRGDGARPARALARAQRGGGGAHADRPPRRHRARAGDPRAGGQRTAHRRHGHRDPARARH